MIATSAYAVKVDESPLAIGLMIGVHNKPGEALSDGPQSLKPERFTRLMEELRPLAQALGREL